jgi:integrase
MKQLQKSATTAAYQDATLKKDGTQTIYLRMTIDRKIRTFPTGIAIPAKFWDKAKQQVKLNISGLPNAWGIAANLTAQKTELDKLILDLQSKGEAVTFASVERRMASGSKTKLIDYCIWRRDCEAAQRATGTVKGYNAYISNFRKYDPDIQITEITPRWLEEYQEWLFSEGDYKNNSILAIFRYLQKIMSHATKHGDIAANPFVHFKKVKWQTVEKQYLTSEELTRLLEMYHGGTFHTENLPAKYNHGGKDSHHHCLQQFLASCFCGLRFSDIAKLKPRDFHGSYLSIVMKKTAEPLRIPINTPLRSVLNLDEGATSVFQGRNYVNGHMNTKLMEIMEIAGIGKHITFHSGRHTFAIMALEVGIPIEVVSHILGHSNLGITQIYARVVDQQKTREMAKMDAFMGKMRPFPTEPAALSVKRV